MTAILGISAFYHDSAAALCWTAASSPQLRRSGSPESNTTRRFPLTRSPIACVKAGCRRPSLDYVAFYDKPLTKFERLLETYLAYAPRGFRSFRLAMPLWLKDKLHMRRTLRSGLGGPTRARLIFTDHHESHAASAFFPSPFDQAAIVTLDGVGEWSTATFGVGEGNRIQLTEQIVFPHSLGLLYSAFTYYCGFKVNSGEYKLMGLAPYGRPIYRDVILDRLMDLKARRQFLAQHGVFQLLPGADDDQPALSSPFRWATASARVVSGAAAHGHRRQHSGRHRGGCAADRPACVPADWNEAPGLGGGVALNCVANGRLLREGDFEDLWIQPAAGDAGGALGAALFVWYQLLNNPRRPAGRDAQHGSFLGPGFTNDQISRFLFEHGVSGQHFGEESELLDHVASLLADGKIVGWFQGRMEFGPRALARAASWVTPARRPCRLP